MKTILVLYPGCIELEVMLAVELLGRAGTVIAVTPDGADHVGRGGVRWRAGGVYADAPREGVTAVLVPGGDPGSVVENAALAELLRDCCANGAVMGAICAGPLLLAKAGLLVGRAMTHGYGAREEAFVGRFFEGAARVAERVVTDGRIVTGRAEGFVEFGIEVARVCGALGDGEEMNAAEAGRLRAYYASTGGADRAALEARNG